MGSLGDVFFSAPRTALDDVITSRQCVKFGAHIYGGKTTSDQ